jgi:lipopolysaccharide transport system ATP-binding protein
MNDTVIKVENLSKKYILRHQQERYTALRDILAGSVKSFGRKLFLPFHSHESQRTGAREEFYALRDISFEIKQGDRVGIIGRNGAGKSTLLKILSRITVPTRGRVEITGRIASLLEVGTGFHPELTGRENIYLNGAVLGMKRDEIRRRFDAIVEFADVERFLDTPVKHFSTGMYLRLAFAIAAHLEPDILIVDEVLAVGDAQFQRKCLGKMEDVGREGKTVLFVSHNMGAIKNLCSSAILLSEGSLHMFGNTNGVIKKYLSTFYPLYKQVNKGSLLVSDEVLDVFEFFASSKSGSSKKIFTTSEDIYITIKYQQKNRSPQLRIGIDLVDMVNVDILFRTFDDDANLIERNCGLKVIQCKIPGNFLKPGNYAAKLQIGIHNVRWITDNQIYEEITVEKIDGVNAYYDDSRPGVIMPLIHWGFIDN